MFSLSIMLLKKEFLDALDAFQDSYISEPDMSLALYLIAKLDRKEALYHPQKQASNCIDSKNGKVLFVTNNVQDNVSPQFLISSKIRRNNTLFHVYSLSNK